MNLSTQAVGLAGEFQAAAIFEQHGIVTTHVDIHGVDLWVQTPSGRRMTVQVKTTQRSIVRKNHVQSSYTFQMRLKETTMADVYCLLALDVGLFRLFSGPEFQIKSTTKHLRSSALTKEAMAEDIKRYLY